jgi:uncharacterized protein DUF1566
MRVVLAACMTALVATAAAAKPPSWDRKIDSPKRFKVLKPFDDAAVLDLETGLVWQRESEAGTENYASAFQGCQFAATGGRLGWRLPRIEELNSLIDPATGLLPAGSPFTVPADAVFWSATSAPGDPTSACTADVDTSGGTFVRPKNTAATQWCVRGGDGVEGP